MSRTTTTDLPTPATIAKEPVAASNSVLEQINNRIAAIAASEKITKLELGLVSRDMLTLFGVERVESPECVNRLIGVLTPRNKQMAVLFFKNFLPFVFDEKNEKFGSMFRQSAVIERRCAAMSEFLSDESATMWTWANDNLEDTKVRAKDYAGDIIKLIARALKDEEQGLDKGEVIKAVLASEISSNDLLDYVDALEELKTKATAEQETAIAF